MTQLDLYLVDPHSDAQQRAAMARQLSRRLDEAGIDVVATPARPAIPSARGSEHLSDAMVLVQVALESGAIKWLVDTIREWLSGTDRTSVEVRFGDDVVVIDKATDEQRDQLIAHFIEATARATRR